MSPARGSFVRARLCEQDNQSTRVTFHFNPSTIKIAKRAEYREQPTQAARESPRPAFLGARAVDLQFNLLLDAGRGQDRSVMAEIQQLLEWTNPTRDSREGTSPSPPVLMFTWGEFKLGASGQFVGLLTSVDATCNLFAPSGAPTRAEVALAMKAAPEEPKGTNPTSGGVSARRAHRVIGGETLAGIAYRTYGDAGCWRAIAELNGLDDPTRLTPGARLLLPDRADLTPGPGRRGGR
ncbi:LysM domain-containing protein [Parafrankia irregularis]|uniref:LysM domain-containing protein n=1 Tax=Parafrankia irregularis TaxID=795642 RepID=A0A0S4QV53_9ACTN|nr:MULTISPECIES: LysM peptidoglycan-binding domain-containing protein [Parafrankia]CUU59579.1 LysM domain-containing protein [Parafrankia irregularis]